MMDIKLWIEYVIKAAREFPDSDTRAVIDIAAKRYELDTSPEYVGRIKVFSHYKDGDYTKPVYRWVKSTDQTRSRK